MTTETIEKNILKRDADGHWYSLPPALSESFGSAVEAILNAEFLSEEWYDANDSLNDQFGKYMKGD